MNPNEPLVYRVDAAARMLSISRSEAYTLVAKGVIPSIRIGSMIRIPADALYKMIAAARSGAQKAQDNERA